VTAEQRAQIERRVLAAVCGGTSDGPLRETARVRLAGYVWSDVTHRAVFDIMMSFPSASLAALRDQIPARLARCGFPDFDFAALFADPEPSRAEVEEWMKQLSGPES
jgi:hypothetical protein